MYLAWFDADKKKPVAQKIAEAVARYREKFKEEPLICLVNPENVVPVAGLDVRPVAPLGKHDIWVGKDDVT